MGQSHYHPCWEEKAFTLGHFFHLHMYEAGVIERTFPALPNVPTMAELPLSGEQESH